MPQLQAFAAAVAIIYNTVGVESLILSRDLVNSIFLGQASWYEPSRRLSAALAAQDCTFLCYLEPEIVWTYCNLYSHSNNVPLRCRSNPELRRLNSRSVESGPGVDFQPEKLAFVRVVRR